MRNLVLLTFVTAYWAISKTSILDTSTKLFILEKPEDESSDTLLVVMWKLNKDGERVVGCRVFSNPQLIEEIMKESDVKLIHASTDQEIQDILEECTEISRPRYGSGSSEDRSDDWMTSVENYSLDSPRHRRQVDSEGTTNTNTAEMTDDTSDNATQNIFDNLIGVLPLIFPGTKWCGNGDRAKNYNDLGIFRNTDMCCRAHDHCPDYITAGETEHGLTNESPFTTLNCQCDDELYKCLAKVNTVPSNTIGNEYFNILRRDCYEEDYPMKCKPYHSFLGLYCFGYESDTTANKTYQFRDPKTYTQLPLPGQQEKYLSNITLPLSADYN